MRYRGFSAHPSGGRGDIGQATVALPKKSHMFEAVMVATKLSLAEVLLSFATDQYDKTRPDNANRMDKLIRHANNLATSGRLSQAKIGDLNGAIARIRAALASNAEEI